MILTMTVNCFAFKLNPNLFAQAESSGIPEDTVYIDVLMPKEAFGDSYVEFNENYRIDSAYRFIKGLSQEPYSEVDLYGTDDISLYHIDGYFSFLAHYDGAETEFGTQQFYTYHDFYYGSDTEFDCTAEFFIKADESDTAPLSTVTVFSRAEKIKLAFIGESGNILLVTEPFSVRDRFFHAKSVEGIAVNGEKVKVDYFTSPFLVAGYFVLGIAAVTALITVAVKVKKKKAVHTVTDEETE